MKSIASKEALQSSFELAKSNTPPFGVKTVFNLKPLPSSKFFLTLFVISFFILGYLGSVTSTPERTLAAQIFTVTYFAYFLLMPFYSKYEKCKPVPDRVQLS